jgi:predicted glycogen debranching enzyme
LISFKKKDLLSSNFEQEFLEANQLGACCSSTLNFCNSRKYHGLFSVRMPELDDFNHILLASIEEQVNINGELFNLANRAYPNHIHPQGYQYIKSFKFDKYPTWKYELGNSKLKKEILLSDNDNTLYIRYTNLNKHDEMLMSIFPFTNFRQMHRQPSYPVPFRYS